MGQASSWCRIFQFRCRQPYRPDYPTGIEEIVWFDEPASSFIIEKPIKAQDKETEVKDSFKHVGFKVNPAQEKDNLEAEDSSAGQLVNYPVFSFVLNSGDNGLKPSTVFNNQRSEKLKFRLI